MEELGANERKVVVKDALDFFSGKNSLSCSLRVLGSQLGLTTDELDTIEDAHERQARLREIFAKCAKSHEGLSWSRLVEALTQPAVKESVLANRIENKYLKKDRSVQTRSRALPYNNIISILTSRLKQHTPVYSGEELTIPNVVNSIPYVTEWQVLGTHLGLDDNDIKVIAENYDAKEHHQRMVETWFARDANRSWDKLRDAIKKTEDALGGRNHVGRWTIAITLYCLHIVLVALAVAALENAVKLPDSYTSEENILNQRYSAGDTRVYPISALSRVFYDAVELNVTGNLTSPSVSLYIVNSTDAHISCVYKNTPSFSKQCTLNHGTYELWDYRLCSNSIIKGKVCVTEDSAPPIHAYIIKGRKNINVWRTNPAARRYHSEITVDIDKVECRSFSYMVYEEDSYIVVVSNPRTNKNDSDTHPNISLTVERWQLSADIKPLTQNCTAKKNYACSVPIPFPTPFTTNYKTNFTVVVATSTTTQPDIDWDKGWYIKLTYHRKPETWFILCFIYVFVTFLFLLHVTV